MVVCVLGLVLVCCGILGGKVKKFLVVSIYLKNVILVVFAGYGYLECEVYLLWIGSRFH